MSVAPIVQTNWDWRAAGNFIGGGTGSGLLIVTAATIYNGINDYSLVLLSMLFVMGGLFLVWLEIGRPFRFLNVYLNPFSSWMSRESYLASILVLCGLCTFWFQSQGLLGVAFIFAWLFLYSQARILKAARGIHAWRIPQVVPLIMTTGIVEGTGVFLIACIVLPVLKNSIDLVEIMIVSWTLIIFRLWAWFTYKQVLEKNAPRQTQNLIVLSEGPFLLYGHIIPALLVIAAAIFSGVASAFIFISGLCLVLSGWGIKFIIITRAALNQGYALAHSPARGGGKPAPGIKPGWSVE